VVQARSTQSWQGGTSQRCVELGRTFTIEIGWCPAHKGDPGNEKADEWAKLAAEKLDARGVERLPRSLSHLKREISGGRITRKK
jgi:ribonuclease HI